MEREITKKEWIVLILVVTVECVILTYLSNLGIFDFLK